MDEIGREKKKKKKPLTWIREFDVHENGLRNGRNRSQEATAQCTVYSRESWCAALSLFISKPISLSRKLALFSTGLKMTARDSTPPHRHNAIYTLIAFLPPPHLCILYFFPSLTIWRSRDSNVIFIPFLLKDASGWYRLLNGNVGRQRHFAVKKQIDLNNSTIGKSLIQLFRRFYI
jgi:hypothetical protein